MPYKIVRKGTKFEVINKDTGESHGMHDTMHKAVAQMRLLYGIEGGMKPTGKKGKKFVIRKK
jgi:hypothetical protein